jgi:hypothetical protein
MTRDAAKPEFLDARAIRGPKNGTDIVETADIVEDCAKREFRFFLPRLLAGQKFWMA